MGMAFFKTWFNHLTIYSFIWALTLLLYSLKFIDYFNITCEAWFYIFFSWFLFCLGSATIILLKPSRKKPLAITVGLLHAERKLSLLIILTSIIGFIGTLSDFWILKSEYGSIINIITFSNEIYVRRITQNLSSGIPYIGSLSLTAACFAGIHLAIVKRVRFIHILPLLISALQSFVSMGRVWLLFALGLFFCGYMIVFSSYVQSSKRYWKNIIFVILAVIVLLCLSSFAISSIRGIIACFPCESKKMEVLRNLHPFFPPCYVYLATPPVVFSEFIKTGGKESYGLFSPILRFFYRIKLIEENIPSYEEMHSTPINMNVGTYLKDIYNDFGGEGILIMAFIGGMLTTRLFLDRKQLNLNKTIILTYIFLFIFFSWFTAIIKLTYIMISLIAALICSILININLKRFLLDKNRR